MSELLGVALWSGPAHADTPAQPATSQIMHDTALTTLAVGLLITTIFLIALVLRLRENSHRRELAEHQLHTALACISDGFAIFDADDNLVMDNEQSRSMSAPSEPDAEYDEPSHTVEALNRPSHETEMELADGRWILHRQRKLPDGGKVEVRTDITALKARERIFKDNAERYRDLVERSPVPIFVHRNQMIIYANQATAKLLGHDRPARIIGKNIFESVHKDHHKLALMRLENAAEASAPLPTIGMKFQRADGTTLYTEAQVTPITFDGEPAFESILHDISSRRRMERALMESEQRYRTLFELAPDAMLVHDGDQILFANKATASILGAKNDMDLYGFSITALSAGDGEQCALTNSTKKKENLVQLCRLKRLDGEPFDAEVMTAPANYHGQKVFHAVIRDVTERKRMDATMAQNAKLASLGGMAAGLAHELSQPLNIMRFAAEGGLLKMNRGKADEEMHAKNYKLIQDQAERMGATMDNMRIFSRKDPGPLQPFDVALSVRNIKHLVRNPFRVDDVHIQLTGPVSGITSFGNVVQFEQVLLNLLNNARDAILIKREKTNVDEPGRIYISCSRNKPHNNVTIQITDDGDGISAEHIDQVFDPYFTTKDVGQGTGLGLALSHEIITAMSGTLTARNSDPNTHGAGGASFSITLPLCTATANAADGADGKQPETNQGHLQPLALPQNSGHVLVVEDEVEAAQAMRDFLEEEGFSVALAQNGREGLQAYRNHRPDVVITDIRMPGMDGAELIEALRVEQADLPIIAVTGHMGETETIDAGTGSPPIDVLKKPVSLQALSRKIGEICTP